MKRKRLVVGTFNPGKAREMVGLLGGLPVEVVSLAECPGARPVEETGETFEENAAQKASGFAKQLGALVVADDSGLEVDALGGRPGVRSARYGGPGLDDRARTLRLLEELGDTPDESRTARFRCAIALAGPDRVRFTVCGAVEGRIARQPAGESGFGYDPVFTPEGYARTFAELGPEVKQRVSHRARALRLFRERIERDGLPM